MKDTDDSLHTVGMTADKDGADGGSGASLMSSFDGSGARLSPQVRE